MRSRRHALVTAALLSVLALAGCGDDGSDEAADPSSSDSSSTSSPDPTPSATASSDGSCAYAPDGQKPAREVEPPAEKPTVSGEVPVLISTSSGDLSATLDADAAPCTVNSFVSLAGQAYYDDTPCHRLTTAESGIFVLQCGDPSGTGYGGPGYTIPDELSGSETYPPGTIAMAKTEAPNSGGSQFFLVYEDTPLPPDYTVFGQLDDASLKTVQKIAEGGTADGTSSGPPAKPVFITGVTFED